MNYLNAALPADHDQSKSKSDIAGISVIVIPFPALGDLTIYLRLGWLFHQAGAKVTFYSDVLLPVQDYFDWLDVMPERGNDLTRLAAEFDLVVACFEKSYRMEAWRSEYATHENIAIVTAKKISKDSGLDGRAVTVKGHRFPGASRAFCLDSRSGKTMVDWVDHYASQVFGLQTDAAQDWFTIPNAIRNSQLVLIFPTTPEQKKNYWIRGFGLLAKSLQRRGWQVEFVCVPKEHAVVQQALSGFTVNSFPNLKALIDHVATASVVISNDSGGGHLASMLGLITFTITRRRKNFVWRPGFNAKNTVIYPIFRFKWLNKKYVWQPFVPVWRIATQLGKRADS